MGIKEQGYDFTIMGCDLLLTCYACPEQYDVFLGETQIGDLRLRHGSFTAEYPDVGGELVYKSYTAGDGGFLDDEREHYLVHAVEALLQYKNKLDCGNQS